MARLKSLAAVRIRGPRQFMPFLGLMLMAACNSVDGPPAPQPPFAHLEKISADSQAFDFAMNVPVTKVRVLDRNGSPLAGILVSYRLMSGAGTVLSDADGIATVPEWKPTYLGEVWLPVWLEGVDSIRFTMDIVCLPHQTIELGVPVSGELVDGDCEEYCYEYCYFNQVEDHYSLVTTSTVMVKLGVTGSTGPAPSVEIFDADSYAVATSYYDPSIAGVSPVWAILAAGSYEVVLMDNSGGGYQVAATSVASDPGCKVVFVMRGTTTSQDLDSLDCVDQSRYIDSFEVFVRREQPVIVSLASSAFAGVLSIQETDYFPGGVLVPAQRATGSPGTPARLSATCDVGTLCRFRITASSGTASTTGAYTLTVQ